MPSNRQETWARGFFLFALLASLVGFLGYYDAQGFVTTPPVIVLALQLVAASAGVMLLRHRLLANIRGVLPLILVAVWAAITLVWADDPSTALRRWLLVFAPAILICLLAASDPRPRQTFVWFTGLVAVITIASGAFFAVIMAFWETTIAENALRYFLIDVNGWVFGIAEGGRQYELGLYIPRFSGLTSNPNSLGLFAAIGFIALAAIARPKRDARGVGLILVIGIVIFLLLMSGSRAAFAMTAAGIFFVVLLRTNRRRTARFAVLLVCAMTLSLYLVTWLTGATQDLSHVEVFELRDRAQGWQIAIRAIGDVWMAGLGFGLTQEAIYAPLGLQTAAHSLSLSMLVETGVVGFVLVLATWFSPVFRATQQGRTVTATDIAIVALLMGLFVHQTVDSSVFRYHWAHFVFVYLLGASAGLSGSRTNA
ncbi:MAG: O-antigen ligase family protein [Rhodospirillaceae bacterium]|jgi:O-antigen ligase|nr:O-antigen ligase family protein [Rhodospirillaceae bacterium]MBT5944965.1 O-antigen ligase family protein [Rhodospirillaceae bacterium]MBT6403587.1 O-antigen ligase family protein [Rhodospirillaceae bacterium]MBT6535457.1 O-antigen ligase family protein [Rhodospirillaceae bacterium]MBT7361811.1 O-antigen ligase family protein [Rhodospirillaceae bacterium]